MGTFAKEVHEDQHFLVFGLNEVVEELALHQLLRLLGQHEKAAYAVQKVALTKVHLKSITFPVSFNTILRNRQN